MGQPLELEFHEAMLTIYRRAKSEAKYNAIRFLQMVSDHGGLDNVGQRGIVSNIREYCSLTRVFRAAHFVR